MLRGGYSRKNDDKMRYPETSSRMAQVERMQELEEKISRCLDGDNRRQLQEEKGIDFDSRGSNSGELGTLVDFIGSVA